MHVVLKERDGFQKEYEREFESVQAPQTFKIRQYERLQSAFVYNPTDVLKCIDREFYLKANFYALGKQIAYYEEI